jgi:hypothetical protein
MSGFNAVGTQAIGTNATIVDESASLTANSNFTVVDVGVSSEVGKLTASSLVSLSEKGLSTELPELTADSLFVANEVSDVSELAELTSSSEFNVIDVSDVSEVTKLTANSLLNLTDSGISKELPELTSQSNITSVDSGKSQESPELTANSQFKANETNINISELGDVLANSNLNVNDSAIGGKVSTLASTSVTSLEENGIAVESGAVTANGLSEINKREEDFPDIKRKQALLGKSKDVEIKKEKASYDVIVPVISNDRNNFTINAPSIREFSHSKELKFSSINKVSKNYKVKSPITISDNLQKFVKSDIVVKEFKDNSVKSPIIISDNKSIDVDWDKSKSKKIISAL